jgi:hypothetical protein
MANARPPQPQVQKRPAGAAPPVQARAQPAAARPATAPTRAPVRATASARPGLTAAAPAKAAAPAPRPPADPVLESLIRTIVGLEAVVEEETQALQLRQPVDLDVFSNRKSQGLMELNRSMQHIDGARHRTQLAPRLDSLRSKLAANQAALALHLEAVREISGIIANAIREQDSDGTYSHTIRRPEAAYGYD